MAYKNLCSLCTLIMGQSPDSTSYNKDGKGLPFYQGNADFGEVNPTPTVWCNAPKKIAEENDILISVRAPIGDMNIANERCCIGRGLAAIRINNTNLIDRDYLYHFLDSIVINLQEQGTGSTFKAINKGTLENISIPCIPIEEQKAVARVLVDLKHAIKKKEQQLSEFDDLIKSRFILQEVA